MEKGALPKLNSAVDEPEPPSEIAGYIVPLIPVKAELVVVPFSISL